MSWKFGIFLNIYRNKVATQIMRLRFSKIGVTHKHYESKNEKIKLDKRDGQGTY